MIFYASMKIENLFLIEQSQKTKYVLKNAISASVQKVNLYNKCLIWIDCNKVVVKSENRKHEN